MGYTYCTKLSVDSSVDSTGTNDASYFNPPYGYPFAGFVNFTKYNGGSIPSPNLFEASNDYLQRWDSSSGMIEPVNNTVMCSEVNGTCVKINDMYCSTFNGNFSKYTNQESFNNDNKKFLSMVPLSRNINSDKSGLSFFMNLPNEIKTQYEINLPYDTNDSILGCYLDFCAAGFCKSNIPYIGLEYIYRMINNSSTLPKLENNYYSLYSSDIANNIFGPSECWSLLDQNSDTYNETYEWPGYGESLLTSPYSLVRYAFGYEEHGTNLNDIVYSNVYDDKDNQDCLAFKLCKSIASGISEITEKNVSDASIVKDLNNKDGYEHAYKITFENTNNISSDDKNIIVSYVTLLNNAGAIYQYNKTNNSYEFVDNKPIYIDLIFNNNNNSNLVSYNITIGHFNTCSLYSYDSSLSYYLNKKEDFKPGQKVNNIENDVYLYVIRNIADIFSPGNTDWGDSNLSKIFLKNCNSTIAAGSIYNRMDLYPNTSGKMEFLGNSLNKNLYTGNDSSTFKLKTSEYKTNLYTNYIPAFTGIPTWSNSSMSNMGVIEEDVKIKFNGSLYISEVTLVFDSSTITHLSESATIKVGEGETQVTKNITDGIENSENNIEFTFPFNASTSPARIWSSSGKATKNNMQVYTVGTQQMLKYCSFPGYTASENTSFDSIYRLDKDSNYSSSGTKDINPADSQMTFTKITGRIPVYISGSGLYDNDDTNVKLISAYVKLTDDSSLDVIVNTIGLDKKTNRPSDKGPLYWLLASQNKDYKNGIGFVSPKRLELPYTIYQPFLGSMSGDIPRYSSSNDSSYNMGVLSFTSSDVKYKSKIGLDSSNNVICVSPNYNKSSANGGTLKTFSELYPNSAYTTDLEFKQLTYDLGLQKSDGTMATGTRGTSVGADSSVYYSISKNPFASEHTSIESQLNDGSTYIDFLLPVAHLNTFLVYDSVEFNRASAWTFMRSMPLQPGSANAPHILIYKVEAWVTKAQDVVDEDSTKSMYFDYEFSNIFSGYVDDANYKSEIPDGSVYKLCVKGINELINDPDFLNNCYLKVDDGGNTEELNAVGTAFPIKDITGNEDFYGAPGLTAKIYSHIESFEDSSDNINDNEIYNKLFLKAKTLLNNDSSASSEEAQVVVLSYCDPSTKELKSSSTGSADKRKVIYICVGFYNNREEMIPINGKFGITYTVTTGSGDDTTDTKYTKYMYLSEFFPKDSMIYLAGNNYKNNTEKEENNKFAFVTSSISETYSKLIGDGVNSNDASISTDDFEIINIGPGDGMSYEIASSSTSKRPDEENGYWGYPGHYGILNRYTGKVSFVSDVPYENYTEYTNSLKGKCLLNYEHICYFPNKTGVVELL